MQNNAVFRPSKLKNCIFKSSVLKIPSSVFRKIRSEPRLCTYFPQCLEADNLWPICTEMFVLGWYHANYVNVSDQFQLQNFNISYGQLRYFIIEVPPTIWSHWKITQSQHIFIGMLIIVCREYLKGLLPPWLKEDNSNIPLPIDPNQRTIFVG